MVVFIVDAISRKYFTSEVSWLWDIDFEKLNNNNIQKIVLAGKYVHDLSVRLRYANIDNSIIYATEDLDEMMEYIKKSDEKNIFVITCFSDRMKFLNRSKQ